MFSLLLILFVTVPLIEVWLIVTAGGVLGPVPTVGIIFVTGIVGAAVARWEGVKALRRVQGALAEGRLPGQELVSGLLILVGGVLLLTPGFLTDAVGFTCVLPPTRELIAAGLRRVLARQLKSGGIRFGSSATIVDFGGFGDARAGQGSSTVIDVEAEESAEPDASGPGPRALRPGDR